MSNINKIQKLIFEAIYRLVMYGTSAAHNLNEMRENIDCNTKFAKWNETKD